MHLELSSNIIFAHENSFTASSKRDHGMFSHVRMNEILDDRLNEARHDH